MLKYNSPFSKLYYNSICTRQLSGCNFFFGLVFFGCLTGRPGSLLSQLLFQKFRLFLELFLLAQCPEFFFLFGRFFE